LYNGQTIAGRQPGNPSTLFVQSMNGTGLQSPFEHKNGSLIKQPLRDVHSDHFSPQELSGQRT